MADSFKAARQEFFDNVILGASHFTEAVNYHPAAGGSTVALSNVLVDATETLRDFDAVAERVEQIFVTLSRDPASDNGGVAAPTLGDHIERTEGNAPERFYSYTGEVIEETPHSWKLRFERGSVAFVGEQNVRPR